MPSWVPSVIVGVGGLVWGVWSWLRGERRRLSIQQHGDNIINTAYHHAEVSTLFILDVSVTNDSPKSTIVISHYELELPWNDPNVGPLPDPADTEQTLYRFSDTLIQYPRDMVINHRCLDSGKLNPGDTIKGLFMARGRAPIPRGLTPGLESDARRVRFRAAIASIVGTLSDQEEREDAPFQDGSGLLSDL